MPLAVASAGALLAAEDMPVSEYRAGWRQRPAHSLPEEHPLLAYPEAVSKAWHLSLDRLERRSAAAARLLGICSVMAPDVSFDLIYSGAMVDVLRDLDSGISEPNMISRLVTQIDLLALIKVEYTARQIAFTGSSRRSS